MNFGDWTQLIQNAGGNVSTVDQSWLLSQFQARVSPALIANQIRLGQAPQAPSLAPASGPRQFPSLPSICGFILCLNGSAMIVGSFVLVYFGINTQSASSPLAFYLVLGAIIVMATGSFFVVTGTYVRKNIHQFIS